MMRLAVAMGWVCARPIPPARVSICVCDVVLRSTVDVNAAARFAGFVTDGQHTHAAPSAGTFGRELKPEGTMEARTRNAGHVAESSSRGVSRLGCCPLLACSRSDHSYCERKRHG
ncbi:hypothetical protein C8Q70DRAFT_134682 [Cubamyces menziesii]|nr:hypothetical protein C8Q70DRAFT_134682 [Cubamyces menziesii]